MHYIQIRRLILFFIILLYFLTLLVPTFKSLPHTPHETIYVYFSALIIPILKPEILITREFLPSMLFIIFHVLYLAINNYANLDPRVTETLFDFFLALFFPMNLWLYIRLERDWESLKKLGVYILFFIVLTLITTSIGLLLHPTAARDLIGNDNPAEVLSLLRLNIATYDFQYLMVFVAPLAYYFYKLSRNKLWLLMLALIIFEVVYAQIVAVIFLLGLNLVLSFVILNRQLTFKKYIQNLIIVGAIFLLTKKWIVELLNYFSVALPLNLEMVALKFKEVALYLESGNQIDEKLNANMYGYQIRQEISRNSFFKSPIIGGGDSGGHHFWLDLLAEHGILGFLPWVLVFIIFFKSTGNIFILSERVIILNSILIFSLIGLNKNILIYSMPTFIFFIVPLLLFKFGSNQGRFKKL